MKKQVSVCAWLKGMHAEMERHAEIRKDYERNIGKIGVADGLLKNMIECEQRIKQMQEVLNETYIMI